MLHVSAVIGLLLLCGTGYDVKTRLSLPLIAPLPVAISVTLPSDADGKADVSIGAFGAAGAACITAMLH